MIYLDNAATTFPKPKEVYDALDKANRELAFNAGRGSYKGASAATKVIADTRIKLGKLYNCRTSDKVVISSSATEALNQILRGLPLSENAIVYISPYEHNAVVRTLHDMHKKKGIEIRLLPLNNDLTIDIEQTKYLFSVDKPELVVCSMVSNVTGYILPIEEIFLEAKKYDMYTVVDAAQAAGLLDIDMTRLNADIVCFAGHKSLNGPLGVAGFVINDAVALDTVYTGGTGSDSLNLEMPLTVPERYEASSKNVVAIAGLKASLDILEPQTHYEKLKELTDYLYDSLSNIPTVRVYGSYPPEQRICMVSFVVEGYLSEDIGTILNDEFDIAVRTGYHCAPYIHEYLNDGQSGGTIRASLGLFNTKEDIDGLIDAINTL